MIATTAEAGVTAGENTSHPWLRSASWDLKFLILSAAIAFLPYLVYVFLGGDALQTAGTKGTRAYDARVMVNVLVALLIGGPHMYATFTRTLMDPSFVKKRFWFVASSLLVPFAVFVMATYSYQSYVWLLSIFFAFASVHALHQLIWISEAYNQKAAQSTGWWSRFVDYGVVLSSLYPIAIWKMVEGRFRIGPVQLKYNELIGGWYWLAYLVFAFFLFMLGAFAVKTAQEYREGTLNLPKTLLISITATLMFWTPASPNMDTAFQGVNAWHSFQYLALTWYANKLREKRTGRRLTFLHGIDSLWEKSRRLAAKQWKQRRSKRPPLGLVLVAFLRRIDGSTGWSTFYLLCVGMLPISGLLIIFAGVFWPHAHGDLPGSDEAYTYMGILSVLLVHYVHDALLFTDSQAIVDDPQPTAGTNIG